MIIKRPTTATWGEIVLLIDATAQVEEVEKARFVFR
jgi:hypothetical protein